MVSRFRVEMAGFEPARSALSARLTSRLHLHLKSAVEKHDGALIYYNLLLPSQAEIPAVTYTPDEPLPLDLVKV